MASQMRKAFASIASKTGSISPGDELMILSTSEVAVCCSRASFSSRLSRVTSVSLPAATGLRARVAFGALGRADILRRCRLATLRLGLTRRLIRFPRGLGGYRIGLGQAR